MCSETLRLKPVADVSRLLDVMSSQGLKASQLYNQLFEFQMMNLPDNQYDLHESLEAKDVLPLLPLMEWLEDPLEVRVSAEDVCTLHGVMYQHLAPKRESCAGLSYEEQRLMLHLSCAVGNLAEPPGGF